MIFDRTMQDVQAAIRLRAEKIQQSQNLTASDYDVLNRGMMSIPTLNRIEEKQQELKSLFNEMGYWNVEVENKHWYAGDMFDEVEFNRIIDNTNVLRSAFFVFKDTPLTPPVSYYYEDINALEKILYDLGVMIDDVESNYRECGDFECGEE